MSAASSPSRLPRTADYDVALPASEAFLEPRTARPAPPASLPEQDGREGMLPLPIDFESFAHRTTLMDRLCGIAPGAAVALSIGFNTAAAGLVFSFLATREPGEVCYVALPHPLDKNICGISQP